MYYLYMSHNIQFRICGSYFAWATKPISVMKVNMLVDTTQMVKTEDYDELQ